MIKGCLRAHRGTDETRLAMTSKLLEWSNGYMKVNYTILFTFMFEIFLKLKILNISSKCYTLQEFHFIIIFL